MAAYQDRTSTRGIKRTFGICYQTLMIWVGEKVAALPAFEDTLLPSQNGDMLEPDGILELRAKQSPGVLAVDRPLMAHPPDRGLHGGRPQLGGSDELAGACS